MGLTAIGLLEEINDISGNSYELMATMWCGFVLKCG
jgi:hypothetical protein